MPTARANNITMHYEEAGQGEPLLLLHGLGSSCDDWELQIPVFARHYRVIAPDVRGHGRSDKPPGPTSMPQMAADVLGLLDEFRLASAHVVGLSMGGMIAFQMAVDCPERVRSLVIVNSGPALVPRTAGEWLRIRQRLLLARLFSPARSGKFLSRRLFPKPEQEAMRAQLIERWSRNDAQAYRAAMRALVGWSVLNRIGDIRCPVLVISGDRDYTPAEAKRAYTNLIPGARLVLFEDSGHATPIDQAERFNEMVLEFLGSTRGGTMERARVGIYVYKDQAYLPTIARIQTGGWFDMDPVLTCPLGIEEIANAIETMVAKGHVTIESTHPDMGSLYKGAVLRATKTRSWKELAKSGVSYSIYFTPDSIHISMSRLDKKGRWEYDPDKARILPADTTTVQIAEIIMADVQSRREGVQ